MLTAAPVYAGPATAQSKSLLAFGDKASAKIILTDITIPGNLGELVRQSRTAVGEYREFPTASGGEVLLPSAMACGQPLQLPTINHSLLPPDAGRVPRVPRRQHSPTLGGSADQTQQAASRGLPLRV